MFQNIRFISLTFAILMILTVSVHPAMAETEVRDKIDKTTAAIGRIQQAGLKCPACAAGLSNGAPGRSANMTNISVRIRQVPLDGGMDDKTISGAETIRLPMGTLEILTDGYAESVQGSVSVQGHESDPRPSLQDNGSAGNPASFRNVRSTNAGDASEERIAEFDRDPAVQAYIRNVTLLWGYTNRTEALVERFASNFYGINITQNSGGLFEVVTYTYTNLTTNYRFKFAASQVIAANGTAVPPKIVIPGDEFPPLAAGKDKDAECWYWYLLIGIAVLAVIAAILVSVGLAFAGGGAAGAGYFKSTPPGHNNAMKVFWKNTLADPNYAELHPHSPPLSEWPLSVWITTFLISLFVFLVVLVALIAPLVGAAIVFLVSTIIGLLVCKGLVQDANDRAHLKERLNPENWVRIAEQSNGQPIFVPSERGSMVMIALNESTENGMPRIWNATANPPLKSESFQLAYPDDPATRVRVWMFMTPVNQTASFSARYVRADAPAGAGEKEFTVVFVPLSWVPSDVDTSSKWVGYGSSLALDPITDRMHVAYLDYSGTWEGAGQLIYRSGTGTNWSLPFVVDNSIGWTTRGDTELARHTSIALDPYGNPQISYMDWKTGHLKFARPITERDAGVWRGSKVSVHDRWLTETVDDTSSYAGWGSSIAVDREGNPHISYLRQAGFLNPPELKYAHWTGRYWDIQTIATISGNIDSTKLWTENVKDGALTSIALDSSGRPHISYADAGGYNGDPMYSMTCTGEMCVPNLQLRYASWNGSAWITESVDRDLWHWGAYTRHGLYSSLALDADDHPHISYFSNWDNICINIPVLDLIHFAYFCDYNLLGNLKYATSDGSAWKTEVVDDSTNSVGLYTSLKVDKYGNPHISYMDWKNGFLRYATKRTSAWYRSIPDRQTSDTGRFTSLALDASGFPRIVYMDFKNGHLKYVYGNFTRANGLSSDATPVTTNTTVSPAKPVTSSPTISPSPARDEPVRLLQFPAAHSSGYMQAAPSSSPAPSARETESISPQGQSGSLSYIAKEMSAGEKVTYAFGNPSAENPVSVQSVSIVPKESIPESRCVVRQESPSQGFRLHGGPAAYKNIEISWINPSVITDATIGFVVTRAWLDENHIDPADIVLMRQHDLKWTQLVTTLDHQAGDMYYYTAVTPGFSYFAVTDKKTASAAVTVPTATITQSVENQPAPVTATTSPATTGSLKAATGPAKPVVTTTGTPAPVPSGPVPETGTPVPGTSIPVLWLIAAGLVSMLLVAGFFIGRRLWWKHQNPKLFGRD